MRKNIIHSKKFDFLNAAITVIEAVSYIALAPFKLLQSFCQILKIFSK